jgi:hypothetical protein
MSSNQGHEYEALKDVVEASSTSAFNVVGSMTQANQKEGVESYQGSTSDLLNELNAMEFIPPEDEDEDEHVDRSLPEDVKNNVEMSEDSYSLEGAIAAMRRGIYSICEWWNSLSEPGQEQTVGPVTRFFNGIVNAFSLGSSADATAGSAGEREPINQAGSKKFKSDYSSISLDDSDDSDDEEAQGAVTKKPFDKKA